MSFRARLQRPHAFLRRRGEAERAASGLSRRLGLRCSPGWAGGAVVAIALAGAWHEVLLVALPEELVFRGVIQGEWARFARRWWSPPLAAAVTFALAHVALGGGWLTLFPGLLFGLLRLMSGSVWPAVAAHAVANLLWLA